MTELKTIAQSFCLYINSLIMSTSNNKNRFEGKVPKYIGQTGDDKDYYIMYWEDGTSTAIVHYSCIEAELNAALGYETMCKLWDDFNSKEDTLL